MSCKEVEDVNDSKANKAIRDESVNRWRNYFGLSHKGAKYVTGETFINIIKTLMHLVTNLNNCLCYL